MEATSFEMRDHLDRQTVNVNGTWICADNQHPIFLACEMPQWTKSWTFTQVESLASAHCNKNHHIHEHKHHILF